MAAHRLRDRGRDGKLLAALCWRGVSFAGAERKLCEGGELRQAAFAGGERETPFEFRRAAGRSSWAGVDRLGVRSRHADMVMAVDAAA